MMNVLRDGRSERGTARVGKRHDLKTVRWYVLTLPTTGVARRDKISPAKSLDAELSRRKRRGETLFEYFAPSYVEVRKVDGKMVNTKRPLLFNYVFVRSSVEEIFQMKRTLPLYNFLPRVSSGGMTHFPYLSDDEMGNLRWVAESYSNELPVYVPEAGYLRKGDRIRITDGRFKGVEASVVIQPGVGEREVMVCVDNWMWVPLLRVQPGEYEVISLAEEGKHVYTRLDNSRIQNGLHEALGRHWGDGGVTAIDRELATETLRAYGELQLDSAVMRCKLYSLLLPAYTILGDEERQKSLIGTIVSFLPLIRAEQSLALLLLTLYGCTDSSIYYYRAHELIDPWSRESSPKKSKLSLIRRLADYDRWLKHVGIEN